MNGPEYGSKTGQHDQPRQQADLYQDWMQGGYECTWEEFRNWYDPQPPTGHIDAYLGCDHPPCEDWLRDTIDMAFVHADRIEIEQWSFPAEDPVITRAERAAGFWAELEERGAQEER